MGAGIPYKLDGPPSKNHSNALLSGLAEVGVDERCSRAAVSLTATFR